MFVTAAFALVAVSAIAASTLNTVTGPDLDSPQTLGASSNQILAENPPEYQCSTYQVPEAPEINLASAPAGISSDVSEQTYTVYGDTARSLGDNLKRCAPFSSSGDGHAYTAYRINWTFTPQPLTAETCTITDVKVGSRIVYHYPNWANSGSATDNLVSQWTVYMERLREHETGHGNYVEASANNILGILNSLPVALNCDEATVNATNAALRELDRLKANHKAYDQETQHGATQGALFSAD